MMPMDSLSPPLQWSGGTLRTNQCRRTTAAAAPTDSAHKERRNGGEGKGEFEAPFSASRIFVRGIFSCGRGGWVTGGALGVKMGMGRRRRGKGASLQPSSLSLYDLLLPPPPAASSSCADAQPSVLCPPFPPSGSVSLGGLGCWGEKQDDFFTSPLPRPRFNGLPPGKGRRGVACRRRR